MASGCILADCPVCGELVWEDEDYEITELPVTVSGNREAIVHEHCQKLMNRDREAVIIILDREERFKETITAKNNLIEHLKQENDRLWELLKYLTTLRIVQNRDKEEK